MKTKWLLGVVVASLSLVSFADAADDLELQAYDTGWSAADKFCVDLKNPGSGLLTMRMRSLGTRNITDTFKSHCKDGFDAYINNNAACQSRMNAASAYDKMWKARTDSCT